MCRVCTDGTISYYSKGMLLCRFLVFFFLLLIVKRTTYDLVRAPKGRPHLAVTVRRSLCMSCFVFCWNALRFNPHRGNHLFIDSVLSIARVGFLPNGMGVQQT